MGTGLLLLLMVALFPFAVKLIVNVEERLEKRSEHGSQNLAQ